MKNFILSVVIAIGVSLILALLVGLTVLYVATRPTVSPELTSPTHATSFPTENVY